MPIISGFRSSSTWPTSRSNVLAASVLAGSLLLGAPPLQGGVDKTVHNLTATGPGTIKASGASELCVFCHTPHSASTTRALWNRDLPPRTYDLYASSTLVATVKQPTGASRLCLSCHDGTTALGALRIAPMGGPVNISPLTGRASLGTDLSNDHPISFLYDESLARRRGELATPSAVPATLPLDSARQMQCTSCHDPHGQKYRKFLRMNDRQGALCLGCHVMNEWRYAAHATSTATWRGIGSNPWPRSPYTTVSDNGCENCHQPHAAAHPARLLSQAQERTVCLVCHTGSVASMNLEAELLKPSAHPIAATNLVHDPREDPRTMLRHVTCADCHNPHQSASGSASPPYLSGRLKGVSGISLLGETRKWATQEYEICFKCHGITDQTTPGIVRFHNVRNVRWEFQINNPSYHPVAAVGRHPTIQGLEAGYTASSRITCSDCHNNDERGTSKGRPSGPHGSRFEPILIRQYEQTDGVQESFQSYALCYGCHNRSAVLKSPPHGHVDGDGVSCAVCHDAHGSRLSIRLINFMLRDKTGKRIVDRNSKGLILFTPLGQGHGECSLRCHEIDHVRMRY